MFVPRSQTMSNERPQASSDRVPRRRCLRRFDCSLHERHPRAIGDSDGGECFRARPGNSSMTVTAADHDAAASLNSAPGPIGVEQSVHVGVC